MPPELALLPLGRLRVQARLLQLSHLSGPASVYRGVRGSSRGPRGGVRRRGTDRGRRLLACVLSRGRELHVPCGGGGVHVQGWGVVVLLEGARRVRAERGRKGLHRGVRGVPRRGGDAEG